MRVPPEQAPAPRQWLRDWADAGFPDPVAQMRAYLQTLIETITVKPAAKKGQPTFDPARVQIVWRAGVVERRPRRRKSA